MSELSPRDERSAARDSRDRPPSAIALYIHIPFCQVRCHYCDFTTFVSRDEQQDRYIDAVLKELEHYPTAEITVSTVYLGGGTPSLLSGEQMSLLLSGIRALITLSPSLEVTAECNPGTVDEEKLGAYRVAGINRLSFGAQAFDSRLLQTLGRLHGVEQTTESVEMARAAGFDNINLDLMFGLPGQTLGGWEATLAVALTLHPQHLSVYGLTVEPGTRFGQWYREGRLAPLADEDEAAAMLESARNFLTGRGYRHYEIANFALPGFEARHNLTYWRNRNYIGLGVGAHSYFRRRRYANPVSLRDYFGTVPAFAGTAEQSLREEIEETAFLNLRLLEEGLSLRAFRERFGLDFREVYPSVLPGLVQEGWLVQEGDRLRLTPPAIAVGNEVFERFLDPALDRPAIDPASGRR